MGFDRGRGAGLQFGIARHFQGACGNLAVFQAIFPGVPPGHAHRRQFQAAAAGGHQGFAFLAAADYPALVHLVAHLRLVRVAPQALGLGRRQRWYLGAGEAFDHQHQATGQGVAGPHGFRIGAPGFGQGEVARR
ncbi:hypothetical protein D3C78_1531970 [compost metagenome]